MACALDEGEGLLDFCLGDSSEPEIFWFVKIRSVAVYYESLNTVVERLEDLSGFDDFVLISRCDSGRSRLRFVNRLLCSSVVADAAANRVEAFDDGGCRILCESCGFARIRREIAFDHGLDRSLVGVVASG